MNELLAHLKNAEVVLTVAGWFLAAIGALVAMLYRSMWKAINLANESAEDAHNEAHKLTDGVYIYLEDVRRLRDEQVQELDRRLTVLETEHRNCVNRK